MKIESTKGTELPFMIDPDNSDNRMVIFFNETLLSSLELTARPLLSSEPFEFKPFIDPQKTLPLPEGSAELDIQARSKTAGPYAISLIQPHFRELEIHLKPKDPSKIEEGIELVEGPKGIVRTWIDDRVFDAFQVSINLLYRSNFKNWFQEPQ